MPPGQPGQDLVQLFVSNERLPANDGNMKRTVLVDQRQEPFNEPVTAEVAELSKIDRVPQMVAGVRIAPGAGERTLAGDFDREDGSVTL